MTTHSVHVANTVPFGQMRYIRRYKNHVEYKDLGKFPTLGANDEEEQKHLEFLQKYMKVSYCDLYFCDKAILVEGASERLLIPDMIRKCDAEGIFGDLSLENQYYTILEVGGAYAHLFYDFVDYLGIPTLIITGTKFVKDFFDTPIHAICYANLIHIHTDVIFYKERGRIHPEMLCRQNFSCGYRGRWSRLTKQML